MGNEEILKMVKEGTITVEEGTRLLDAMNKKEEQVPATLSDATQGKMLRVYVDAQDEEDGPVKVRVNLPITLFKAGMKSGKSFEMNGKKLDDYVDLDLVLELIESGQLGEIVTVESKDANVRVVIE